MSDCKPEDCLDFPIAKKCAEYCMEQFLRIAESHEMISILKMDEDLAEAISEAYNTGSPVNSFEDLRSKLTSEQIASIIATSVNLTESQIHYFRDKRGD